MEINFEIDFDILNESIKPKEKKKEEYKTLINKYFEQLEIVPAQNGKQTKFKRC